MGDLLNLKKLIESGGEITGYDEQPLPTDERITQPFTTLDSDDIHAIIRSPVLRAKTKHWSDKLVCEYCGNSYTRNHRAEHRRSKVCQAYQNMNQRLHRMLLLPQ